MKKIIIFSLILCLLFSVVGCSKTPIENTTQPETTPTEPFETVEDKGKVNIEKEYTMEEILDIKTNWNKEYVFPCEVDKVKIEKQDKTNITMSLLATEKTFQQLIDFYNKYTANKNNKNSTKTNETYFISFEEDYVSRTIMLVKNKDNTRITITYSMDNVNRR